MSDTKTYLVVWPDNSSISYLDVSAARRQAEKTLKDEPNPTQMRVYMADFNTKELTLIVTYRLKSIEGPLKIELI